ncbi:MAG TPA: mechanosensitive ion channel domain-containing protein [Verrucomicrobiae bacterium]|nr:mechanosensitive ion channel domain-containing protein [Verrucomicrobiae bacterium]
MHRLLKLSLVWVILAGIRQMSAGASPMTNAPPAAATNAVPIATTEIAAQSESTLSSIRAIEAESTSDPGITAIEQQLPVVTEEIGARSEENARILAHSTSLELFGRLENSWRGLSEELAEGNRSLTRHAKQLQGNAQHLDQIARSWEQTRKALTPADAPPELLQRVDSVLEEIKKAHEQVNQQLTQALRLQSRVTEEQTRVQESINAIDQARNQIMRHLFVRDSPPLWSGELRHDAPQTLTTQGQHSLDRQSKELRSYIARRGERMLLQLLLFVALAVVLARAHRKLSILSLTNETLEPTARSLGAPVASALLIALLASPWIYSEAPRLLWSILGALAVIPALMVLRRLLAPSLFGTLNVLACLYLIDQLRTVAASQPAMWRLLFLPETLAGFIYCLVLLGRRRAGQFLNTSALSRKILLASLRLAAALLGGVLLCNLVGYGRLSSLVGNVTFSAAYLALVLYAAIRVGEALVTVLLTVSPLARLGMVRSHTALLTAWVGRVLQWVAVAAWTFYVLEKLALRQSLANALRTAVGARIVIGTLNFTVGHVLLFAAVLWGAFLVSRLLRFVLEEEVYPHVRMAPGLHYSISKTLHYVILLVGFLIALAMLGFNLTKLTILAGAFGVGLGFGMQNIVNNFVSGIILLFERPVKVGDVIQLDNTEGVVKRIGIRASIVRTSNGSEIIVPNAKLISDPVTNWTFSQRRRLISMPVAVASEIEPRRVMDVLRRVAGGHPLVAKDGPVQTLLTNLNNGTASYELRAWTDQSENWEQVRSDLFILVKASLATEGIPMR